MEKNSKSHLILRMQENYKLYMYSGNIKFKNNIKTLFNKYKEIGGKRTYKNIIKLK